MILDYIIVPGLPGDIYFSISKIVKGFWAEPKIVMPILLIDDAKLQPKKIPAKKKS